MDNIPNLSTVCQCLSQLELQNFRSLLNDHRAKKLFTGCKHGVKMHTRVVVADPENLVYPDRIIASTVDVNETELSLELVTDPEAIHVMDRGFQKHEHFDQWDQHNLNFITRIRENTQFEVTRDFRVPKADRAFIVSDRKVILNKCSRRLRLVIFRDDAEREYYLITNCFDVAAVEIAQMYKYRWLIEFFFKWIKQHLRFVKVFSYSPQGIWNQLYLVLISFALCTLVRLQTATTKTTWDILKMIRIYAYQPWAAMRKALARKPSRTSKGRQRSPDPNEMRVQRKVIVR